MSIDTVTFVADTCASGGLAFYSADPTLLLSQHCACGGLFRGFLVLVGQFCLPLLDEGIQAELKGKSIGRREQI